MVAEVIELLVLVVFLFVGTVIWKIQSDNMRAFKGLTKLPKTPKKGAVRNRH